MSDVALDSLSAADWKHHAAALIRRVDPHYHGPLYLLDMGEAFADSDNVLGCTSVLFDLQLRGRLKELRLWTGRGFACGIDAGGIQETFRNTGLPELDALRRIVAIVLHEFSHFVVNRPPISEARADAILAGCPSLDTYLRTLPIPVGKGADDVPHWDRHDFRFGRAAIHVWHRASALLPAWDWHPNDIWESASYRLSSPLTYVAALGDEPQRRSREPLRQIIESPVPADFDHFGLRDIERARAQLVRNSNNTFSEKGNP